ncbi:MAG: hypothetical protein AAF917_07700 [Pseudomonadota bacterium]
MTPTSYQRWLDYLRRHGPTMSSAEMDACSRLATVLLCGEQSAIRIFAAEVQRGRAPVEVLTALQDIERDEELHEQALSAFTYYLPAADDAHAIKRRAQRFFASLGRAEDPASHFARISYLDSAVCKIMWHIEGSSLNKHSPLRYIASAIKTDEARHVSVSRNYARSLNPEVMRDGDEADAIQQGLVEMLAPLGDSFEVVGVDSDRLFAQLASGKRE